MSLEKILLFFAGFIESELGIIYAEHNYFQLENRLEEITKLMGLASLEKLYESAQFGIHGPFKQLLIDLATNNETSFFRDQKVFKAIEQTVLPRFLELEGPSEQLRIWSAASSSGQEALSLAMLLEEWNLRKISKTPYSILGSDICERILVKANAGNYSQLEVQRGLPSPLLIKYFRKNELDRWIATDCLMSHIHYQKQNLLEPFLFSQKFHMILCRNVLIYQNVTSKIEILNRLSDQLMPGGFLVLGSGESLLGLNQNFEQINSEGAVVYLRKEKVCAAA